MAKLESSYNLIDSFTLQDAAKGGDSNAKVINTLIKSLETIKAVSFGQANSCDFKKGLCRISREKLSYGQDFHIVRSNCCLECFYGQGYYNTSDHTDVITIETFLTQLGRKFRKDIGFWRARGGCVIPRSLRSDRCILHMCVSNEKERDLLIEFSTSLCMISDTIHELYVESGFKYINSSTI